MVRTFLPSLIASASITLPRRGFANPCCFRLANTRVQLRSLEEHDVACHLRTSRLTTLVNVKAGSIDN